MNALMFTPSRRDPAWFGRSALAVVAVAMAIVGVGLLPGPSMPARAGDEGPGNAPEDPASRQDFIREDRRTVKQYDDRLIALARRVLEEPNSSRSLGDQVMNLRFQVAKAEADYQNAKLTREVAEIAVKEYTEGVFPQDLATIEGELAIARSDLKRSRDLAEVAKQGRDRTKEAADGRTDDFGARALLAMLELDRRKYALELAESKKKLLLEYTKPRKVKELEADARKAHADELARQATWELMKAKLDKLQEAAREPWPSSPVGKRLLGLIDRAIPIEEQVHARLDQLAGATDSGETLRKEIAARAKELGGIIEEAEAARSADEFARLRSSLRREARR